MGQQAFLIFFFFPTTPCRDPSTVEYSELALEYSELALIFLCHFTHMQKKAAHNLEALGTIARLTVTS